MRLPATTADNFPVSQGSRSSAGSAAIDLVEELLRSLLHACVAAAQRIAPHCFDAQLVIDGAADDFEHGLLGRFDGGLIAAQDANALRERGPFPWGVATTPRRCYISTSHDVIVRAEARTISDHPESDRKGAIHG